MFADCERRERERRTEGRKERHKERGSKSEWGEAETDEWRYRKSKVSSSFWRDPGNICTFRIHLPRSDKP